jgi:hypothetical protein
MDPVFHFENAMLSVMAFAGTVLLLFVLALVSGWLGLNGRRRGARRALLAGAGVAAAYAVALVAVSARAEERVIAPGEWKYFCELDCHLAYSVAGVERQDSTLDGHAVEVVTLNLRFDPETVGPNRGSGGLHPNPRRVRLIASDGRDHPLDQEATRALEMQRGLPPWMHRTVRPGETLRLSLVFTLPMGVRGERLRFEESEGPTPLLIGHESSVFHPSITFALNPSAERTAVR